ncbi:cytosine permease [bacterium]|nr:cytosine permease [bacterium]
MHTPHHADETLIDEDLAPVPSDKRTWTTWSFAALWISMAACIPTYMLASSLIDKGMNWWQPALTATLGNVSVLIPMILNAPTGTKYGIPFRTGGIITRIIGLPMMPWKLVADPSGYIFTWLVGYSALLGPIAGILIADYFVLRRCELDIGDRDHTAGIYRYHSGFSFAGIGAFILAMLPNRPGFLVQVELLDGTVVPDFLEGLYQQA